MSRGRGPMSRAPAQTSRLEARAIVLRLTSLRLVLGVLSASPHFTSADAMPRLLVLCLLPRRRVTPLGLQLGRRLARLELRRRQRPKSSAVSGGPRLRAARSRTRVRARSVQLRRERLEGRRRGEGGRLVWRLWFRVAFGGPGRPPPGREGRGLSRRQPHTVPAVLRRRLWCRRLLPAFPRGESWAASGFQGSEVGTGGPLEERGVVFQKSRLGHLGKEILLLRLRQAALRGRQPDFLGRLTRIWLGSKWRIQRAARTDTALRVLSRTASLGSWCCLRPS